MKSVFKVTWSIIRLRLQSINERQLLIILSLVVGLISGLAAILLKNTIHYTHHFLTKQFHIANANYLYLAYPFVGIIITVIFVKVFVKDNIGHGVSRILFAISQKNGIIKSHNNFSSILASTVTIGFGGSVGAEAPIVLTGASIGSNLGRMLKLNYKNLILLIGCGAAGAISGIFKAPIAGVVFTLEVLMLDLTMASIVPLLISAVTAATLAYFFMGESVILSYDVTSVFKIADVPFYIILAVIGGLISWYFTRGAMFFESKFGQINKQYQRVMVGGLILGILIFVFPPLYGEGYTSLIQLLNGNSEALVSNSILYGFKDNFWLYAMILVSILFFKVLATAATTGAGGVGGIFAPTLFMGGITGYLVAIIINKTGIVYVEPSNFILAGMAALMAGVMHAPLTGIFLIAEITGGYQLLIPLIITSTVSYLTIMYFEPHSIYTKRLALRGELITHHKDKAVLTLLKLGRVIEKDLITVHPNSSLGELVKVISKSKRNIFPVVDEFNTLMGIVLLDDVREIIFNPEMYADTKVHELMIIPPTHVSSHEPMEKVMEKFEKSGSWNLPVIDEGKYVGFISKSKIFNVYRKILLNVSEH
jgi:chloride channel protein, CIC family